MQTLDTAVLCIRRLTSHGGATDDRVFGVEAFPGSLNVRTKMFVFSRQLTAGLVRPQRDRKPGVSPFVPRQIFFGALSYVKETVNNIK